MIPIRNKTVISALMLVSLLAGQALAADGDVGTPAIDYTLNTLGGGSYTLSQQSGQVVMMFVIGYG